MSDSGMTRQLCVTRLNSTRDPCDSWLDSTRALISVTRDSTRTRPSWLVTRLGTRPKWLVNSSVIHIFILQHRIMKCTNSKYLQKKILKILVGLDCQEEEGHKRTHGIAYYVPSCLLLWKQSSTMHQMPFQDHALNVSARLLLTTFYQMLSQDLEMSFNSKYIGTSL